MGQIYPDVSVFWDSSNIFDDNKRFHLSSGIRRYLKLVNSDGVSYEESVFLPSSPWKLVSDVDLDILQNRGVWSSHNSIAIYHFPSKILSSLYYALQTIQDDNLSTISESAKTICREALNKILSHLLESGLAKGEIQNLGVNLSPPNLITTTRDYDKPEMENPYIGLHIDSWDHLSLQHRSLSRAC